MLTAVPLGSRTRRTLVPSTINHSALLTAVCITQNAATPFFISCVPCPLTTLTLKRYASLGAHEERDQSRKDDLESLLYVFLDLYIGKLPWAEHVSPPPSV